MNYDQLVFHSAFNFIKNHIGQFLAGHEEKLIALCTDYLEKQYDLTARAAERVSINALGEIQTGRQVIHLDTDGLVVYIRDSVTRKTYAFTLSMLRKIAPEYGMALRHA